MQKQFILFTRPRFAVSSTLGTLANFKWRSSHYSRFVSRLQNTLGQDVVGHSIRSGGATAIPLAGLQPRRGTRGSEITYISYVFKK